MNSTRSSFRIGIGATMKKERIQSWYRLILDENLRIQKDNVRDHAISQLVDTWYFIMTSFVQRIPDLTLMALSTLKLYICTSQSSLLNLIPSLD